MANVWVTPEGFQLKTLQEYRQDLETMYREVFGEAVDLSEEGPNGEIISKLALAFSKEAQGGQEVWANHDPSQAEGAGLDIVCAFTGIRRLPAGQGNAPCLLYTESTNTVLVPAGKQVRRVRGALVYSLISDVTITPTACRDIYLRIPNHLVGVTVTLITTFGTFSVVTGLTPESTYAAMAAAIMNSGWTGVATSFANSTDAPENAVFNSQPALRLTHETLGFGVTVGTPWALIGVGSYGVFICSTTGPEYALAGEITEIVTPVPGWTKVYNQVDANPGRNIETDAELRIRRAQTLRAGYGTDDAIRLNLLNSVPNIVTAIVISNRSDSPDSEGRPPHSYEAVIEGGLDTDIAKILWKVQPSGIQSVGELSAPATDSMGITRYLRFNRPETIYLWMRVTYWLYDEEVFPDEGESQIKSALLDWAAIEYTLGKNVIPQRAFGTIYTVAGIGRVVVEAALTPGATGSPVYSEATLPVSGRQRASLALSRITVIRGS